MRRTRGIIFAALTTVVLLSPGAMGAPSPAEVHFTAVGDIGIEPATTGPVLQGMADVAPDLDLALGDLSYAPTGQEQAWCDFVTERVGSGFPFELLAGNHESDGENGNINDFSACLPNQLPGAVGTYGRQYYVDVPQDQPLVRYVMISPGLTFPDGRWDYRPGTAQYDWTAAAIDGARKRDIPWVVVGMHEPCLLLGTFGCGPGADLTNLLLSKRVDLVLSGHVHNYQRSKQLALGPGCGSLAIGSYDPDCVVDAGNDLAAGAGTVFMSIGTGGTSQMDIPADDPEAGYFAATAGSSSAPTYGFGDFDVTADRLTAGFRRTGGDAFTDTFSLTKGLTPPPNQDPVARFTTSSTGLTADLDATASDDPDGTVAGYGWTFGDGSTSSGRTPRHTYDQPGTYPVTLTVTDAEGATGTVTHSVTVTAPVPSDVLAADTFDRTLTDGWGDADAGGSWAEHTPPGVTAVSGGKGRTTLQSAGDHASYRLTGVSSTRTDLTMELSLDSLPTGTHAWLYESALMRRIDGVNYYRAMLRINEDGGVRASIHRMVSRQGTQLTSEPFVSDLTYAPGQTLMLRAQATGTAPTTLRMKVWQKGTPEPADWLFTVTDASAELQQPGTVGLITYLTASTTNAPLGAAVDNVDVVDPAS